MYVDANNYTRVHTHVYILSKSVERYTHEYDIHRDKMKRGWHYFFDFFLVPQVLRRHLLPASERVLVVDFRVDPVSEPLRV